MVRSFTRRAVPWAAVAAGAAASPAMAGFSSVMPGDTASASLRMYGVNGTAMPINSLGNVPVQRAHAPVSIGENQNGLVINGSRGNVLFSWDEIVGDTTNQIVANFQTSDHQNFLTPTTSYANEPFFGWTWNFGTTDPVTWRNGVAAAPLYEAKVQFSSDGGQTFYQTVSIISGLNNPWSGSDFGSTQTDIGVNYVRLVYTIGQVPSPGVLGVLGLCTTCAARRRRR